MKKNYPAFGKPANFKLHQPKLFSLLMLFCLISLKAQVTNVPLTPGTTNWTVPVGVTSIDVKAWGGGGSGGGSQTFSTTGGSGGGGGGYSASNGIAVGSDTTIPVTVGAAGTSAGNDANGNAGGATTILGHIANGGGAGLRRAGAAGAGGTSSGGTTNNPGSVGVVGNGSSGGNGGTAFSGGAAGAGANNGNGGTGGLPGGGGGGGRSSGALNGARSGGAGGNGQILISYIRPTITAFSPTGCVNPGTSVTITGTNFTGATSVTFNGTASTFTINSATSISTTVPTGATSGNIVVTVPTGFATSTIFRINPLVAPITGASFVCQGNTTALSNATPGGLWNSSNTSVATISSGGIVNGVASGSATISYAVTSGGCTTTVNMPFTVRALPILSGPSSVCLGSTVQLSPTSGGSWLSNSPSVATIDNAGNVTTISTGTATFTYTDATSTCSATTASFYVVGNPAITTPPVITQTICDGGVATISIAATGGNLSYQWYNGATAITGAITNTITFNPAALGDSSSNYHCIVTNACGSVDSSVSELIVNSRPVISNMTATACSTDMFTVMPLNGVPSASTIVPAGTIYSWGIPTVTGGITGGAAGINESFISGTLTNPTNAAQTATYTVTPVSGTSGNCAGVPFTVVVTVNPVPDINNLSPSICSGILYSIIPPNGGGNIVPVGTTFSWGVPSVTGGITGATTGSGQSSFSQTLVNPTNSVQTATYNITATSGLCVGSTFTLNLTVNPQPTIAAGPATQIICSGASITPIIATNPNAVPGFTTYNWTRNNTTNITGLASGSGDAISGSLTNNTSVQQTAVFTIVAISEEGCISSQTTVSVVLDPLPVVSAISSQSICSGANISTVNLNASVAGTTFTWSRDNTINVTGIADSGVGSPISGSLVNNTNATQVTTFTVVPTSGGCTNPAGAATFTITVNPAPAVAASPATQTICGGGSISIAASDTNNVSGTAYSFTKDSTVAGDSVSISGGLITGTLANNSGVDRIVTFTITATSNGCPSSTTVAVIVTPNPVFTPTPATQFACNGTAFVTIALPAVPGVTYDWTRTNVLAAGNLSGMPDSMTNVSSIDGTFTNLTSTNQTTTFTITATINGCSRTSTASITVYPVLTAPVVAESQTVCTGSRPTPVAMTTLPAGGSGGYTYQWQSAGAAAGPWNNIAGATAASYWPPTTTAATLPTLYRLVVTNGLCGANVTSNYVTISVANNLNFTFSISNGGGTVCPGSAFNPTITSGQFFPDSYIRYSWTADVNYISPSTGGPIGTTNTVTIFGFPLYSISTATLPLTTINNTNANVTTTIFMTPNIYDSDTNAFICSLSPQSTTVTIRPRPVATVIAPAPGTTICSGTSAGMTVTGNITTETMSYTITRSVNANVTSSRTFPVASGTIAAGGSYTLNDNLTNTSASTQTVTYSIVPRSASGCNGIATTFTVTIAPPVIPGTIGTNQSVCSGGDPALLTEITAASGSGTLTYQWLSGPTATGPWTPIGGATATTYDPSAGLTITTYFIRQVSSVVNGVTCSVANTIPVKITVNTINPGIIAGNQTICSGGDPAIFTVPTPATGAGALSYQWQSNTTGCGGTWADISGATAAAYDVPAGLAVTTYYRRKVDSNISGQICTGYTNCIVVTVNSVTPGSVGNDEILCGNNPAAFAQITPSTGSGTLTYQWESSTTSCGAGFTSIAGATGIVYDPPSGLTQTTYYHRITYSTLGASVCSTISNCITVTANSVTGGTISGNRTVCSGGDPVAFTQTAAATGTGLTYQWQISTTGGSGPWTNIAGATASTYDAPGPVTQVTYFQRVAMATVAGNTCSANSNFVTVFVNTVSPSTVAGDQSLCSNSDPAAFTTATAATGAGALTYQWQSSTIGCGGPWTSIPGATSATYDPSFLTQTTYFHVIVNSTLNAVVCSATSNCITVANLSKMWNGSVSIDWNEPLNWTPNGIPTSSTCVIIPNTTIKPYVVGSGYDAYAYSLTILNGGQLEIIPNNAITVTDIVNVNAGGNFIVKSTASLIQINNVTDAGTVNIERITQPMYRYDYTYWNSPVTSASNYTLGMLSPNTQPDKYYRWNPTNAGGNGGWLQEGVGTMMLPTRGYIVRAPNSFSTSATTTQPYTANFIGTPNNGDIQIPISVGTLPATTYFDKMNLIGNPYPSAVSADLFLNDPANVSLLDGTLYFWTHHSPPSSAYANPFYGTFTNNYTAGDYATYNTLGAVATVPSGYGGPVPNGFIASGQSFFVKGLGNGNAIFKNSMRHKSNSTFFRASQQIERHRIWLNLGNEGAGFSQALVGYAEGASNDLDRGYDGEAFSGNFVSLYSINSGRNLSIQGRVLPFEESDVVDLGYRATAAGTCMVGIDHVDGLFDQQPVYLEDRLLNVIFDIRQTPYIFASEAGVFNERFALRFTNQSLSVNNFNAPQNVIALITKEKLLVQASSNIVKIDVYDMLGSLVKSFTPDLKSRLFEQPFTASEGIYIARIMLDTGITADVKMVNQN